MSLGTDEVVHESRRSEQLRSGNPPEVLEATVLNILKENQQQMSKTNSYETLESTGEMKLIMKFYLCLHNFSLKFIFLTFHGKLK